MTAPESGVGDLMAALRHSVETVKKDRADRAERTVTAPESPPRAAEVMHDLSYGGKQISLAHAQSMLAHLARNGYGVTCLSCGAGPNEHRADCTAERWSPS